MGEIACDECGEQPYLSPATGDSEYDVEMRCDCPRNVPIEFVGKTFSSDKPDHWGESGTRFVCYRCGSVPVMRSSTSIAGTHQTVTYHASCDCEHTRVGIGFRGILPDDWKRDMDGTKWDDYSDEIRRIVEDEGPLTRDEIAERVDLDPAGVKYHVIDMDRKQDLVRTRIDGDLKYLTPSMQIDRDMAKLEEPDEHGSEDEQETGRPASGHSGLVSGIKRILRDLRGDR